MREAISVIKKITFDKLNIITFFFIVSCFFSRLNSNFFFIDIFGHVSFQILISGILLFFILLTLKRKWTTIICFSTCVLLSIDILISCNHCNALIKDKSQNYNKIRLVTFNTGLSKDFKNIQKMILSEKPDVILFQEISPKMQKELNTLKSIFPYSAGLSAPIEHFSSVILSKHPLKNNKITGQYVVSTTLMFREKELTIIGIHMFAPLNSLLTKAIYGALYKNLSKPPADPNQFSLAMKQMQHLKNLIGTKDQNLIIMGDLNMSGTSKRFTNFLEEVNLHTYISYTKRISTWPTNLPNFFGIQIDHVLFSKNFKVLNKKVTSHFGSDHRPLIVDLVF